MGFFFLFGDDVNGEEVIGVVDIGEGPIFIVDPIPMGFSVSCPHGDSLSSGGGASSGIDEGRFEDSASPARSGVVLSVAVALAIGEVFTVWVTLGNAIDPGGSIVGVKFSFVSVAG